MKIKLKTTLWQKPEKEQIKFLINYLYWTGFITAINTLIYTYETNYLMITLNAMIFITILLIIITKNRNEKLKCNT